MVYYIIFLVRATNPFTKLPNTMMKVLLVILLVPLLGLECDVFLLMSHFDAISGELEYAYWRGNEVFTRIISIQLLIVSVLYWSETFWCIHDLKQVFQERTSFFLEHPRAIDINGDWKESSGSLEPAVIGQPRSMDLDRMAEDLHLDPFTSGSDDEGDFRGDFLSLLNS